MKLTLRRVQDGYQEVGRIAREIVAVRVTFLAGLGIILGELVRDGIVPDGLADWITHWATIAFSLLGVLVGVLWARRGATPTDPQLLPKDKYGNPLVSALDVGPHAGRAELDQADLGPLSKSTGTVSAVAALAAAAALNPQPAQPDPFMQGGSAAALPGTTDPAAMGGQSTTTPSQES